MPVVKHNGIHKNHPQGWVMVIMAMVTRLFDALVGTALQLITGKTVVETPEEPVQYKSPIERELEFEETAGIGSTMYTSLKRKYGEGEQDPRGIARAQQKIVQASGGTMIAHKDEKTAMIVDSNKKDREWLQGDK